MVFDRSHLEMVADVELEEYIPALADHPLDLLELLLVELDVRHGRKGLECDFRVLHYSLVIKGPDRNGCRLDESEDSCIDHLAIEDAWLSIHRKQRLVCAFCAILHADLAVLGTDFLIFLESCGTFFLTTLGCVDSPSCAWRLEKYPRSLESTFHAVEVSHGARLENHMSSLHALCA